MASNRNYGPTPQAPNFIPIPLNQRAINAAVLPATQLIPLAAETVVFNPAVSTIAAPVPLILTIPASSIIEGQPFEILISGDIAIGGATPTAVLKLYSGTSATLANNQLLATTAAAAQPATNNPFWFKASLVGDSGSGRIVGTFKSLLGVTLSAEAALAAVITGVNFKNNPVANFLLTITPNNANASSVIFIDEFGLNF